MMHVELRKAKGKNPKQWVLCIITTMLMIKQNETK